MTSKNYWINVLHGELDKRISKIRKEELEVEKNAITDEEIAIYLSTNPDAARLYAEDRALSAELERIGEEEKKVKSRMLNARSMFIAVTGASVSYYNREDSPKSVMTSRLIDDRIRERIEASPTTEKLKEIEAQKRLVTNAINIASTEKKLRVALAGLCEKLGIDLGIDFS